MSGATGSPLWRMTTAPDTWNVGNDFRERALATPLTGAIFGRDETA